MELKESYQDSKADLMRRLKKIEGQVKGLQKMIDQDKCCGDVLVQVSAIRAAVNRVGTIIIEKHSRKCLKEAGENQEAAIRELVEVLTKYVK